MNAYTVVTYEGEMNSKISASPTGVGGEPVSKVRSYSDVSALKKSRVRQLTIELLSALYILLS